METETLIHRHGTFSSSQMFRLMVTEKGGKGFGEKAQRYIKQVRHERNLGLPINAERDSRPTSWGKFIEQRVFQLLGTEYSHVSDVRLVHPEFEFWTGAPDLFKNDEASDTEADVKCPVSREVFCDKLEALKDIRVYKKEFPEDFFQHVSNSILSGRPYAEAIIYMPYESELQAIRDSVNNYDGDQNPIAWINWAKKEDLPYLLDGGKYKNLNVIRFEVPQSDKDALTERVKMAGKLLEPIKEREAA